MKVRAEAIKLAVFGTVGVLIAVLLYLTLSQQTLGPSRSYAALMTDVSGLESGDMVRVAGVRVGQVDGLSVEAGNVVKVEFHVADDQPLTDSTQVLVRYENLLGDRYLELAQPASAGTALPEGATIPVGRTTPALDLDVLLNGFKPLFQGLSPQQVNELASGLIATLQGRGGTVESLLTRTASLTDGLADNDRVIGSLISNLDTVLGSLDSRDVQLRQTIGEMRHLVSGLAADRDPISTSLTSISRLAGSLDGLFAEVRTPFAETVQSTHEVARLLNRNSQELAETLKILPPTYARLKRVASHGSFFNFYLCSAQVIVSGPNGTVIKTPMVRSNVPRCV
ncbi:MAG TPA: MCE family protein [Nocardioidaceae bacterium]|nr:MCE family protein [Nocardioidaceae bacterium]